MFTSRLPCFVSFYVINKSPSYIIHCDFQLYLSLLILVFSALHLIIYPILITTWCTQTSYSLDKLLKLFPVLTEKFLQTGRGRETGIRGRQDKWPWFCSQVGDFVEGRLTLSSFSSGLSLLAMGVFFSSSENWVKTEENLELNLFAVVYGFLPTRIF